jgi:hypothetical protein
MKRVLVFDGARASKRFTLLWLSLMSGGNLNGDAKDRTPAVIRKEARLQDALEEISDGIDASDGQVDRALKIDEHRVATVMLSQEDFELLQQYSEKTIWTPRASRDVVDLWDWLSTAEKHE